MRDHAHRADGQPASLEGARSRRQRLERLSRLVARLVEVQAGLVDAVDRLERRTGADIDRRAQPDATVSLPPVAARRARRTPVRLAVQTVGALLAGLAVAVVFSAGQGLHPSVGMPPAQADPSTTSTAGVSPQTTTAGQAGSGSAGPTNSTGGPQGRALTRPAMAVPAGPGGPAVATSTSTTLPVVSSTTVTTSAPETSVTLPEIPSTTRPCKKHCDG